jgi:hypothetical protein
MDAMHGCCTQTDLEHRVSYMRVSCRVDRTGRPGCCMVPYSMESAAMGFELTETAGTPYVEAGMPAP